MPSLAFRKASICSRLSFSASCTLVVNPQHATRSRLILCWKLPPPSGSSCIGKDFNLQREGVTYILLVEGVATFLSFRFSELSQSIHLKFPHLKGSTKWKPQ